MEVHQSMLPNQEKAIKTTASCEFNLSDSLTDTSSLLRLSTMAAQSVFRCSFCTLEKWELNDHKIRK